MSKAWYINDDPNLDQRLDLHKHPKEFLSTTELLKTSFPPAASPAWNSLDVNTYRTDGTLDKIRQERDYKYEDELVCSKECLPNYEEVVTAFYTEHIHADEEIRLFLEGTGYFDVRDGDDRWIRISITPGDMIILPAGIYHRFTPAFCTSIKMRRFFTNEPVWKAYNRPVDEMDCRKEYVKKLNEGNCCLLIKQFKY